ncbi:uncharacterized protein LOC126840392 [Adelges cooleyi]|uniref:uncharacterized protein LOC126840392 n=1 Tax=Adelges cooleyi TaxID=133065 RepID=UPI00217FE17A|nr:uncharacterized protein LOC126840392 [Adelges cooleyi]
MSKFFGVLAVVILVQYVIAETPAPVTDEKVAAPLQTNTCNTYEDLKNVDFSTFQSVIGSENNGNLAEIASLKPSFDAWNANQQDENLKQTFLTAIDTAFKTKPDDYSDFRQQIIDAETEANGKSSLPTTCDASTP